LDGMIRINRSLRILSRLGAIAAGIIGIERLCMAPYAANRILHRVDIRSHAAISAADPQHAAILARTSLNELRSIASIEEYDVDYHLLFAANARVLNQTAEALAHYDAALRADQRPEIYFQRGLTLLELGRIPESIPNFVTAARFNPTILNDLDPTIREQVVAGLQH
jgi:tetratricopeptide (TPR) repeat protein